jgi:hypothetical protein
MAQQGQVLKLKTTGADGKPTWAYRYRLDGRGSARPQVGGFATQGEALRAVQVALERLHCRNRRLAQITLGELAEVYLAQHEAEPWTIAKLRWLLAKATGAFGERRPVDLRSDEIGAWRATLPVGHRFEATQALRQVLNRAVAWKIIDSNPAKVGVDNPHHQHPEKRPFESWAEINTRSPSSSARSTGRWSSSPPPRLAARGMDRARAARPRPRGEGRLCAARIRARAAEEDEDAPKSARHAAACDRAGGARTVAGRPDRPLLFPAPRGGYLDLHNFRRRAWKPAQRAAGIEPLRRPYDLRHTFATFALRAGISTFDLSRFMGASLTMIDRHYGHLARDGREHAAALLDSLAANETAAAAWTFGGRRR